jgi:hypothetical protein
MLVRMPEETQPEKKSGPEEMWAVFHGDINAANVAKFVNGITTVGLQGTKRLHILFQSWGGFVGDGSSPGQCHYLEHSRAYMCSCLILTWLRAGVLPGVPPELCRVVIDFVLADEKRLVDSPIT